MKWEEVLSLRIEEAVRLDRAKEFFEIVGKYDYAIIGGVAVSYYVKSRIPTRGEMDIITDKENFEGMYRELIDNGWRVVNRGLREVFEYWVAKKGRDDFDVLVDDDGIVVDDMRVIPVTVSGIRVNVIAPEDLAVLKYIAGRSKDIEDLILLLKSSKINVNRLREKVIKKLGHSAWEEIEVIRQESERGIRLGISRWYESRV